MDTLLHTLCEEVVNEDYVIGSYFLVLNRNENPYEKAKSMAVGQTVGTWLPIPGITEDMRKKHMGRIVNIIDVNPADLSSQVDDEKSSYIFQIAYPVSNFDDRLPLMLTTLLGNVHLLRCRRNFWIFSFLRSWRQDILDLNLDLMESENLLMQKNDQCS